MCGLAGILPGSAGPLREPAALEAELRRMRDRLAHRGPDASDLFVSVHADQGDAAAGLAHTRLSIIDLSESGAQPMASDDGRFVIAYNGEVYNFPALRQALQGEGVRFRGHSDTEVVLRSLERHGLAALRSLDGMFALALLDTHDASVLLARDRVGQKPLYVARLSGRGWAFASELTPLLGVPGADTELDRESLSHILVFGCAPAPHTLRRGIRQLEPGAWMRLRAGADPEHGRFVDAPGPRAPVSEFGVGSDLESQSRALEKALERSVSEHLVADVPVGILLSGGVDSSTIAALAARCAGPVKTFSIVHDDPGYDESREARAVADAIGSEHHELRLPAGGLTEAELDCIVDHHGDPFADSSSLNVLRLSRAMREHVTVALSGDGGDEVFAGYDRFAQLRWLSRLGRLPGIALRGGADLARQLPGERARQIARSLQIASMPVDRRALAFRSLFWPEEQEQILLPEWRPGASGANLDRLLEEHGTRLEPDPVASAHWFEQRLNLPDDMLTKVDRMSMVAALEVRPPLLSNDVLAFAAGLPFSAKNARGEGKRVLRALARRLVPSWVIDRPKKGFALPLIDFGGTVFAEATRFALESEHSSLRRLFLPAALGALSAELLHRGSGRHPEDSSFRRVHRRYLLTILERGLSRLGGC